MKCHSDPIISIPFLKVFVFVNNLINLLGVLSTSLSCLTRLGLDEKVDKEQYREEGSEKNCKVSSELNLKSNSAGWKSLNNRVHSKYGGSNSSSGDYSNSNLASSRDNYKEREEKRLGNYALCENSLKSQQKRTS